MRGVVGSLLGAVLLALGCASPSDKIVSAPRPLDLGEYRIQPGDEIEIYFALNPELSVNTLVRPDGKVSLQLIGEVVAEGRSPSEFGEQLRNAYSSELRDPEVSVNVLSMAARVYVDGQIGKPGEYVWTSDITAMQAIARAGGFLETANSDHFVVLRRGADGAQQVIDIDLDAAKSGQGQSRDVFLAPYDLVLVPESGISEVNRWVDQYIRQNIPVRPREVVPPGGGGGAP